MGEQITAKEEKEVSITYETLFELLRREKSRDELQSLQETFFHDVVNYLSGKMNILANKQSELFATDEREKTLIQLQNIKKIIRELYDRREKKIINMAINKARTQSNIIDTSVLLEQEKSFFQSICSMLENYRESILSKMLQAKIPSSEYIKCAVHSPADNPGLDTEKGEALNTSSGEQENKAEKRNIAIRFLSPVPEFVGPDLGVYGPFEEGDTVDLPKEIAELLLEKQRAELYSD